MGHLNGMLTDISFVSTDTIASSAKGFQAPEFLQLFVKVLIATREVKVELSRSGHAFQSSGNNPA